jgi:hypothetical protein
VRVDIGRCLRVSRRRSDWVFSMTPRQLAARFAALGQAFATLPGKVERVAAAGDATMLILHIRVKDAPEGALEEIRRNFGLF